MASKQTRRTISISGATYDRLRAHCEKYKKPMSGMCERILRAFIMEMPDTDTTEWMEDRLKKKLKDKEKSKDTGKDKEHVEGSEGNAGDAGDAVSDNED